MARFELTREFVDSLPAPGETRIRLYHDAHPDAPTGFALRVTPNGAKAWVLSYLADGRQRRATLGAYSQAKGDAGLTPTAARKRARELQNAIKRDGADPVGEKQAKRAAVRREMEERRHQEEGSLEALLRAYAGHLKAAGKKSHQAVARAFERNVIQPFPALAARLASTIERADFMPTLSRLTRAGKFREAEKLKAYLSAAYRCAVRAEFDATLAEDFGKFRVRINPIQEVTVTRREEPEASPRLWALSEAQLAAYWRRIEAMPDPRGALLRFHLLTGAQRVEQLTRLTTADYDADLDAIRILDGKGRRKKARVHLVPLIPAARRAMELMSDGGPHLFTVSNGREGAVYHTVRDAVLEVAAAMVEAGEIDRTFTPGILRKTVETRLAAAGVSKDIRAQLQSHGIGGVQDKHYDAHDYLPEKRAALTQLRRLCEPRPDNVSSIDEARKKSGTRR